MNTKLVFLNKSEELYHNLNTIESKSTLIIVDSNLSFLEIENYVNHKIAYLSITEGEKNIKSVERIWNLLFENGLDRSSKVLIIGGGVLLDIAAFACSTFKRGITYTLIPSTLLGMVDAAHGGKNGFNNEFGKNQIGTISLPHEVVICFQFLETLPEKIYKEGLIELIKHGLIADDNLFTKIFHSETYQISNELIKKGIDIKVEIVNKDLFESGERKLLNFGHTIGHLIEFDSNYELSHGEAIASGIYYELLLSNKILNLEKSILDQYEELINKLNLVTKYNFKNKKNELITALQNDKKASKSGVDIVLLSKLSEPVIKEISFEKIFEVVDFE